MVRGPVAYCDTCERMTPILQDYHADDTDVHDVVCGVCRLVIGVAGIGEISDEDQQAVKDWEQHDEAKARLAGAKALLGE